MQSVIGLRSEQCAEGSVRTLGRCEAPCRGEGKALPGVAAGRFGVRWVRVWLRTAVVLGAVWCVRSTHPTFVFCA